METHPELEPVPGPWSIRLHEDPDTAEIVGPNGEEIALCCLVDAPRLRAAPELMDALEELVRTASARENTMGDPLTLLNAKQELGQALRKSRALITEARNPYKG